MNLCLGGPGPVATPLIPDMPQTLTHQTRTPLAKGGRQQDTHIDMTPQGEEGGLATGVGPSLHVKPTNPCLGGLTPVTKPLIPDTPQPLTHQLGDTPSKDGRARDTDTSTAYKVLHAHQDTAYVMHEGPRHQKNDNLPNTEPQPIVEPIIYVPHTPDSHLCKTLQAADNVFAALHRQLGLRFAERAGTKIVTDCGRSDPWISFSDCRRQKCLPCRSRAHIQAEEELARAEGSSARMTEVQGGSSVMIAAEPG